MQLDLEDGTIYDDPTSAEVAEALASLDGHRNCFAILAKDEMTYVQVSGGPAMFDMEYQEGSTDRHYRCEDSRLTLYRVTKAFQKYAAGDDSWKDDFRWRQLDLGRSPAIGRWAPRPRRQRRRGCLVPSMAALAILLIVALVC